MSDHYKVAEHQFGRKLRLYTPDRYAMDLAIDTLKFLEADLGVEIPNTGWKAGFGLQVGEGISIRIESTGIELATDGSEITIRRVTGSKYVFEEMCERIKDFVDNSRHNQ